MTNLTVRYVRGYGDYGFGFEGVKRSKNGAEAQIVVSVPCETVQALAAILQHTKSAGHAAWHFNSQEAAPCSQCA